MSCANHFRVLLTVARDLDKPSEAVQVRPPNRPLARVCSAACSLNMCRVARRRVRLMRALSGDCRRWWLEFCQRLTQPLRCLRSIRRRAISSALSFATGSARRAQGQIIRYGCHRPFISALYKHILAVPTAIRAVGLPAEACL